MTTRPDTRRRAGVVLALAAAFGFSMKAIFVKLAFLHSTIDPTSFLALRMGFSLPFFVALAWPRGKDRHREAVLDGPTIRKIVALATLGYFASGYLDFLGLQYVSTGLERLILFSYPSFVVLFEAFARKRLPGRDSLLAMLLSYAGIALVVREDLHLVRLTSGDQEGVVLGCILIFAASLTYAGYLATSRALIVHLGSRRFTGLTLSCACICSILFQLATEPLTQLAQPWPIYALAFATAIFSTVLPTWLLSSAIARIGAGPTALVGSIGPILTFGFAAMVLDESVGPLHLLGAALVVASVWWTSRQPAGAPASDAGGGRGDDGAVV